MNKTIKFKLSKFPTIPNELRANPATNSARDEFVVDLSRLYHHYYLDNYNKRPPVVNHANFEYLQFLSNNSDFRFLSNHVSNSGKKRRMSTELGQAFFRYFMYEFLGVSYFAHMDKVLDKETHPAFDGLLIKKRTKGDVPDYLCARNVFDPFIGEAKGRFSNISFTSKAFDDWRDQFSRIAVVDKNNTPKKLKGFIVATKFTSESNRSSNYSTVLAEDPETFGEELINENYRGIGRGCIAIHYSRVLSKIGINLLSSSLELGFVVPEDLTFNLPVWRCNFGPIAGERFIGGYFSEEEPQIVKTKSGRHFFHPNIFRLEVPTPIFVGLEIEIFRKLRNVCLGNWSQLEELPEVLDSDVRPSNLAWLRDGTISGSIDFFEFENFVTI